MNGLSVTYVTYVTTDKQMNLHFIEINDMHDVT